LGSEKTGAERTNPARVLIADDHDLVRDGFHRMLAGDPELEVVGEARNGREAIELCRSLRPDLVLMDVRMPGIDGLVAMRNIKEELPTISVLVVTTYDDPDYLLEAVAAGAAGYVLKDTRKRQLIDVIRGVLNGEATLDSEVAMKLIRRFAHKPIERRRGERRREAQPVPEKRSGASPRAPFEQLTARELEVLPLMVQGKSNPEIAETLAISKETAKVHVRHIIGKLGVSDRTQAVVLAVERGLVATETDQ
jgi:two-component system NarL family response regulator